MKKKFLRLSDDIFHQCSNIDMTGVLLFESLVDDNAGEKYENCTKQVFYLFFSLPGSLMDILQIANDTVKLFNVIQLLGDDVIDAFTKLMRRSTISTFMDLESSFRIKNMFIRTMLQGFNENMATLKRRVADLELACVNFTIPRSMMFKCPLHSKSIIGIAFYYIFGRII